MEDNFTRQIITAMLELSEKKPLEKITVTELIQKAGVSRTAFNNRFDDMNMLITSIWESRILENSWDGLTSSREDYRLGCLMSFKRYKKYMRFMRQACSMTGQNCLRDHMVSSSVRFELEHLPKGFQNRFSSDEEALEQLQFLASYHAYAVTGLIINWLQRGCRQSPEALADLMTEARFTLLGEYT